MRERERTCAGVQCTVRSKVQHDAWMNDLFWGRNSNLSNALSALPVDCQGIQFPASEKASLN